jgi:hypothetical protein
MMNSGHKPSRPVPRNLQSTVTYVSGLICYLCPRPSAAQWRVATFRLRLTSNCEQIRRGTGHAPRRLVNWGSRADERDISPRTPPVVH